MTTELDLALDSVAGAPLIPEDLEPTLVDLVLRLNPVLAMHEIKQANGKTHEFNRITGIGTARFEGENATTAASDSTYARAAVQLKVLRKRGGVSGFQQASAKKFIDSYKTELMNATRAMAHLNEYAILWADDADAFQYDGYDASLSTNVFEQAGVITLAGLDNLIDSVRTQGLPPREPLYFVMSPRMLSAVSALQTRVQIPIDEVEIEGGFRFKTYRGIPIVESSFTTPVGKMTAVAAVSSATPGALDTNALYRWRVSAVTLEGETEASDEVSITLGVGENAASLSWTAFPGALLYKIYRSEGGGASGTVQYLTTIPAITYNVSGEPTGNVTSFLDTLSDTVRNAARTPMVSVGGVREETIFLIDKNPDLGGYIAGLKNEAGENVENLIQFLRLARVRDAEEFLLVSYQALVVRGERYHAMLRRVRAA